MTFRIRPLVWVKTDYGAFEADVPGGYYMIRSKEQWEATVEIDGVAREYMCSYTISGNEDDDWTKDAESIEEGKSLCEADWRERITPALEPVEDEAPPESDISKYVAQMQVLPWDFGTHAFDTEPEWRDYCGPQSNRYAASSTYSPDGPDERYYAQRFERFIGKDKPLYLFRTVRRETRTWDIEEKGDNL